MGDFYRFPCKNTTAEWVKWRLQYVIAGLIYIYTRIHVHRGRDCTFPGLMKRAKYSSWKSSSRGLTDTSHTPHCSPARRSTQTQNKRLKHWTCLTLKCFPPSVSAATVQCSIHDCVSVHSRWTKLLLRLLLLLSGPETISKWRRSNHTHWNPTACMWSQTTQRGIKTDTTSAGLCQDLVPSNTSCTQWDGLYHFLGSTCEWNGKKNPAQQIQYRFCE